MRRVPREVEEGILKRGLQGATYRMIGHEFGVSIATVARVFEDARKEMFDARALRDLSILLKRVGLSVFDGMRACSLMESLNKWGISLEELESYAKLNEKFLREENLDEGFLSYALKLMQLEQASGKTYQAAVEDFEKKRKEAAEAEEKKLALDKQIFELKAETNEANEKLAELKSEIENAATARKGVAEVGLSKLAQLVRFIREFESLGFDVNQVKRLAMWHRRLQELHIDPDGLGKYIEDRGPLEDQNNSLRLSNERLESDINAIVAQRATLIAQNLALQGIDHVLRTGTLIMRCKSCGHSLPIPLPTQESVLNLVNTGQVLIFDCQVCGMPQWFVPWDIAFQIAWMILPIR